MKKRFYDIEIIDMNKYYRWKVYEDSDEYSRKVVVREGWTDNFVLSTLKALYHRQKLEKEENKLHKLEEKDI